MDSIGLTKVVLIKKYLSQLSDAEDRGLLHLPKGALAGVVANYQLEISRSPEESSDYYFDPLRERWLKELTLFSSKHRLKCRKDPTFINSAMVYFFAGMGKTSAEAAAARVKPNSIRMIYFISCAVKNNLVARPKLASKWNRGTFR